MTTADPVVVATTPVVVLGIDRAGMLSSLTPAWESLSGYPVAESLGMRWRDFIAPVDQARWQEIEEPLYAGANDVGEGCIRLLRRDGEARLVELRMFLVRSPSGTTLGLRGVVVDLSRWRMAGAPAVPALRLSDESMRALIERGAFCLFRCTRDGVMLDLNRAMSTMLGIPESLPLGDVNLFDELGPGAIEREQCLAALDAGANEASCDLRGRRRDGSEVHLRVTVSAEYDGAGRVRFLQGMAENVTERMRREEIVRRGERMASLATTLAGVAHEINNPLAAIAGFAQILLKREQSPDDRHALETMLHESRRAARIVKDLLTIARRQEGGARVRVDVNAVVRYLIDTQRYAMETRGIHVTLQLAPEAPTVLADAAQLEQVVLNLVANARQALEARLQRRSSAPAWVPTLHLATQLSNRDVLLVVVDNGTGIPPLDLPHIWDPFWTTREVGEGTGLGLSVVHSIVVAHGGIIEATSVPDSETRFSVTLPLAPSSARVAPTTPSRASGVPARRGVATHPLDILVVDDETTIRALLNRVLMSRGHAVVLAKDGEHALRLAEQGSFDVVISDLRMPGMDGRALIRRLRALPSSGRTRYLLSTGDATAAASDDDSTSDVAVVTKPYDVHMLVDLVEAC